MLSDLPRDTKLGYGSVASAGAIPHPHFVLLFSYTHDRRNTLDPHGCSRLLVLSRSERGHFHTKALKCHCSGPLGIFSALWYYDL